MTQETSQSEYTVVARRYRPQSFDQMVGQNHIAQALANAIKLNRVGHAYLFTGARGVGKTSSARIFAKCLNCEKGPTVTPCNECDICESVSVGEDIDVLEIDGASNRGIDEIRQLRSNAIVRPSRAKFKIYIIDEVHMLTQQAFNALLKTLEEPPEHVKFIFCTTDPQKIPITVLSRCQRFDFSPVQTVAIIQRLQEICDSEGVAADEEALSVLARRAAGSMRDSQSLLEQLLSFCSEKISIEDVHQLLGTADTRLVKAIVESLAQKQASSCLDQVASAVSGGVDAGQLATQLLGYFRDIMAIRVGAGSESLLTCSDSDVDELKAIADQLGLETTLAIVQLLDHCITRMQSSLHGRTLLEVTIVRICNLENLDVLSDLIDQIGHAQAGAAGARPASPPAVKKNLSREAVANSPVSPRPQAKPETENLVQDSERSKNGSESSQNGSAPSQGNEVPAVAGLEITANTVSRIWQEAAELAGGMTTDIAKQATAVGLEGANIVAEFDDQHVCELCRNSERKNSLEEAIRKLTGQKATIVFRVNERAKRNNTPREPKLTRVQMIRKLEQHELVKNAIEVFEAEVVEFRDMRPKS